MNEQSEAARMNGTCPSACSLPIADWEQCAMCGSTSLHSLGVRQGDGTVLCLNCGAKWFNRWFTAKEWDAWINEENYSI